MLKPVSLIPLCGRAYALGHDMHYLYQIKYYVEDLLFNSTSPGKRFVKTLGRSSALVLQACTQEIQQCRKKRASMPLGIMTPSRPAEAD